VSQGTVVVDAFPERARRYTADHAVVVVDVIRATTTAVTAVALGRRCFPTPSVAAARRLHARLDHALLMGELGGRMPPGFDINNSPAALAARADVGRPAILVSSSGTRLLYAARAAQAVYLACFRNAAAVGRQLAGRHRRIAVIGAGSLGEFRIEDQLCCAWVADALLEAGYEAADARTREIVAQWRTAPAATCADGPSANYLRRSGQLADLDFVLGHVNDVTTVCALLDGEVIALPATNPATTLRQAGLGA
jgi:2-phosphosulfolactate phosphatase